MTLSAPGGGTARTVFCVDSGASALQIDTDASGRIHYTAALRYFEIAEHGLLRELFGGAGTPSTRSFGLPRVHVEADYAAALSYPDQFKCTARVAAVGRT